MSAARLVSVALAVPLRASFDYTVPAETSIPPVGARVRVPFGRRSTIGIVLGHPHESALDPAQIRPIERVLDAEALLDAALLKLLEWAATYYYEPLGEAVLQAVPRWLREGRDPADLAPRRYAATPAGRAALDDGSLVRAPKQALALQLLVAAASLTPAQLREHSVSADVIRRLQERSLIELVRSQPVASGGTEPRTARSTRRPELSDEQREVVARLRAHEAGFRVNLLYGVTGSGKTEVYLRLIEDTLERERQALLLVPEIGLTPQLVARLRERFAHGLAVLHSGLSDRERSIAWQRARSGEAGLVVGTRSAVFAAMPRLGLIVVDEEHDASYKQQTGFRYSARDLAIVRAQQVGVPVILGSATPSLESLHNARAGRYEWLELPTRIGAAGHPRVRVIDMNAHAQRQGLSTPLLESIQMHLRAGTQVILYLNRRGFAPTLFCAQCGRCEQCRNCDAHLSVHAREGRLRCHHCGLSRALHWSCPACGEERVAVGSGTQRIENELQSLFADYSLARLDRDAAGSGAQIHAVLEAVSRGDTDILVGTQMLTKGHDFDRVTLVGILNADQGLFGIGFRGEERLAQAIVQVAGRAGRRDAPGELLVQTRFPEHPLLQRLLAEGYLACAEAMLTDRRRAGWPPFAAVALISADAKRREHAHSFLRRVRELAEPHLGATTLLGPAPAAMERRHGRYHAQLLLQAPERATLHGTLNPIVEGIAAMRQIRSVRWAIDVDPLDV
ncbi:MAG: primosomal protein N' [Gammaproteobacteria bacterium]|jgi:primosomal protein N' (replication factor Y)